MAATRTRIIVDGRVQGVYFRATTVSKAAELGLSGWVHNLPDGRLEAAFEGPAEKVAQAVQWARTGPPRAVVSSLEEHPETPDGLAGFSVRY